MMAGTCQLNVKQALSLCRAVGFSGGNLVTAVAVMGAESGRFVDAFYVNDDPWQSVDRGLFQINSHWHPDLPLDQAFKPVPNARYAYEMSDGGKKWNAWAAYSNGAYLVNMPKVQAVLMAAKAGLWKIPLVKRVENIQRSGDDWNPC